MKQIIRIIIFFSLIFLEISWLLAQTKTGSTSSSSTSDTPAPVLLKRETSDFLDMNETSHFVDEEGNIYKNRRYLGVVPGIRDVSEIDSKKVKPAKDTIMWVGFQPFKLFSRVFIQISGKPAFLIKKEGEKKIIIEFVNTDINLSNDAREIITSEFATSIETIITKVKKSKKEIKTFVTIILKKSAGYLYKQEGDYLFIDVEM